MSRSLLNLEINLEFYRGSKSSRDVLEKYATARFIKDNMKGDKKKMEPLEDYRDRNNKPFLETKCLLNYMCHKVIYFFKFFNITTENHFNKCLFNKTGSCGRHCDKCGSSLTRFVSSLWSYDYCISCKNTFWYSDGISPEDMTDEMINKLRPEIKQQIKAKKSRMIALNNNPNRYLEENRL